MAQSLTVKDGNGLTQVIPTLPVTGQTNMANSLPVTLASDQPTLPVSLPAGTQRTVSSAVYSASGTVSAGARSITFYANGTAAPTVNGVTIPIGATLVFSVDGNDTLGAIPYVASATATLLINTVV